MLRATSSCCSHVLTRRAASVWQEILPRTPSCRSTSWSRRRRAGSARRLSPASGCRDRTCALVGDWLDAVRPRGRLASSLSTTVAHMERDRRGIAPFARAVGRPCASIDWAEAVVTRRFEATRDRPCAHERRPARPPGARAPPSLPQASSDARASSLRSRRRALAATTPAACRSTGSSTALASARATFGDRRGAARSSTELADGAASSEDPSSRAARRAPYRAQFEVADASASRTATARPARRPRRRRHGGGDAQPRSRQRAR